jgi:hypothetical protein
LSFPGGEENWQTIVLEVDSLRRFDPDDPRDLDLGRLRQIAVAFPNPAEGQSIVLHSVEALAEASRLDETGACR